MAFRNPVLPAAGPPVRNGEVMVACARGELVAWCPKRFLFTLRRSL